jgi:hypothetical protein
MGRSSPKGRGIWEGRLQREAKKSIGRSSSKRNEEEYRKVVFKETQRGV